VPVPRGEPAYTAQEARNIATKLEGPVVVKAQIHAGGRGKAGGVKVAKDPNEAEKLAKQILGMTLVSPQTGPQGKEVRRLLVEEALEIDREFYLSLVVDRATAGVTAIASAEGGTEIEVVAAKSPEKILKVPVDPLLGFQPFLARKIAFGLGMGPQVLKPMVRLVGALFNAFTATDASLAEINPLVITKGGDVLALDAKMTFDDNALFRHPDIKELRDLDEEEPLEVEASSYGLNYIKLDGEVGCMVNGAGLAMATMDLIKYYGGEPANFLDIGGSSNPDKVVAALEIITSDPNAKVILFNIFGGITRCDDVANGIVEATKRIDINVPLVIRLTGTNEREGVAILESAGMSAATSMDEVVERAVALAAQA